MKEAQDKTHQVADEVIVEEPNSEASSVDDDVAAAGQAAATDPQEAAEEAETDPVKALEDKVAEAQAQAADWQDKFMRLHAEWDTYRRRTNEQREEEKKRATEGLVGNLIPVLDDFERSIDFAEKNGEDGLLDGVRMVHTKLVDVLVKAGVQVIDPAGQEFNALEAQAVATVDDPNQPDETVQDVYQKGYKMGVKVIRPAMVTVTTGGPKREKPEEE